MPTTTVASWTHRRLASYGAAIFRREWTSARVVGTVVGVDGQGRYNSLVDQEPTTPPIECALAAVCCCCSACHTRVWPSARASADPLRGLEAHGMEPRTVVRRSKRKESEARLIAKHYEATLAGGYAVGGGFAVSGGATRGAGERRGGRLPVAHAVVAHAVLVLRLRRGGSLWLDRRYCDGPVGL